MSNQNKPLFEEKFKTTIGGQALIEGIMMLGPEKQCVAVRDKDEIVVKTEPRKLIKEKYPILGWPLIRGIVNFGSSMVNGVKALMYSASFYPEEEEKPSKLEQWFEKKFGSSALEKAVIYFAVVLGVAFSVFLFILLPTLISGLFNGLLKGYLVNIL